MISASFSYFDTAVVAILGISCLFAFFRGFIKEILSLGAWVGAGLITLYYFPALSAHLAPHFKRPEFAAGIATLVIYIASLLAFSLLNMLILRLLKEGEEVGFLDNMLGLMFGAFRGAFVVSLGYLLISMAMTDEEMPPWIKTARTKPMVEKGAIMLARVAPDYLREISSLRGKIDAAEGIHDKSLLDKVAGSLSPSGGGDTKVVQPADTPPEGAAQ